MRSSPSTASSRPREIAGIDRLVAVEVDLDHSAAHQFNERLVGIAAFEDRDLRARPGQHEQQQLRHEGLASAALRHDQYVGVAQAAIKRRKRHHLPGRGFEQDRR